MKNIDEQIKKFLEEIGASNIKFYMLVNNDGYTFEYKGVKFDLRHWVNVYGVETNFYSLMNNTTPETYQDWIKLFTNMVDQEANKILHGKSYFGR